jgi:hypothetical protein
MASVDNLFWAKPDSDLSMAFATRSQVDGQLPRYRFGVVGYGRFGGLVGCGGVAMRRLLGPYSTFAGVHGTARDFTGVAGTSINHVGVYGQLEDDIFVPSVLHAGVLGAAGTQPGVIGFSANNDGMQGQSFNGAGVSGRTASFTSSGVTGVAGIEGPPPGMGIPAAAGVLGTASDAPGVIGTSNARIGVYGFSTANAGVVGESVNSFAGFFAGNVVVTGTLTAGVKNAAVRFPDGSQRVLHCVESPEHWFEDFGAGKLKGGRATQKLDADFAKVIKRGDYHVFLTPRGDCRGLYVRSQGGASFEVRELAGGKSNVAFSYRIVGRRKDITRHKRFAKVDTRLALPPVRGRRPAPTLRAFIAELEKEARAKATPAMRKSDREVAALPPPEDVPF